MKSKKGAMQLTLEQLTKLILLSVIIILVFIPLGTKLYGYYFPSIDHELKKSLNILVIEAEDLGTDIEKHGVKNPSIIVPIYLVEDSMIIAYVPTPSAETNLWPHIKVITAKKDCKKSCFCIFQEKDNKVLHYCKRLNRLKIKNTNWIKAESTGINNIEIIAEGTSNNILLEIKKL